MKRADGRGATLVRVLAIARQVRGMPYRPALLDALSRQFEVTPRTIRRDLFALCEAGWDAPYPGREVAPLADPGRQEPT